MKNFITRNIEEQDLQAILDIHTSITQQKSHVQTRQSLESQLKRRETVGFAALIDCKVAGFIVGEVKRGDFGLESSLWIINFGVDPRRMGQGIGHSLAERIFEYCRNHQIHDVYSVVRWDSVDLLSFFKSLGFDRSNFINLRKKI